MELSGLGLSSTGGFGGFGNSATGAGWGDVAVAGISAIGNILAARQAAKAYGSGPIYNAFQAPPGYGGVGGVLAGAAGSMIPDLLGGMFGGGGGTMTSSTPGVFAGGPLDVFRPDFYTAGKQRYIPRRLIAVNTPNGGISYWRHVGQPIAFSGDRGLARRIAKVARKLGGGCATSRRKSRRR